MSSSTSAANVSDQAEREPAQQESKSQDSNISGNVSGEIPTDQEEDKYNGKREQVSPRLTSSQTSGLDSLQEPPTQRSPRPSRSGRCSDVAVEACAKSTSVESSRFHSDHSSALIWSLAFQWHNVVLSSKLFQRQCAGDQEGRNLTPMLRSSRRRCTAPVAVEATHLFR